MKDIKAVNQVLETCSWTEELGKDYDSLFIGTITDKDKSDSDDTKWPVTLCSYYTNIKYKIDLGSEASILPTEIFNEIHSIIINFPSNKFTAYMKQKFVLFQQQI